MTEQLVPIPFGTGVDQSLSQVVGEPRIIRMHNARLVAPGRVKISPGYFQPGSPANMRAAVQDDDRLHIVRSSSDLLSVGSYSISETRVYSDEDETIKWAQPAFEAPTRINLPEATATWVAPASTTHLDRWMVLAVKALSAGSEAAYLYLMKGTQIAQQVTTSTSYSSIRFRLATDYTSGAGYLVAVNHATRSTTMYSVSIGDTPLVGTSGSNVTNTSPMIDVAIGGALAGASMSVATLHEDGMVRVWSFSPSLTYQRSITVGATTKTIAVSGLELLCLRSNGEAQTYNLSTGSALSAATAVATPASVIALSKRVSSSKYYLSMDISNATTGDVDSHCYTIDTGTVSGSLAVAEVSWETLSAIPAGAPFVDPSGNVYQTTINRAAVSRSLQVSRVYTDVPLRTRRVFTAAHGEMPLFSMAALQGGIASTFPAANRARIQLPDSLCGASRACYALPSVYVTSGTLTETTSKTAGMVLVFAGDSTSMGDATHTMTHYDAMSVARTQYGRVLSCGAPFAVGQRGLATGFAIDLPVPKVTQEESGGGTSRFTVGQIYQYIVQCEYRAPDGTLFRSPPSQPITYTVVAATGPATTVNGLQITIGVTPESPDMPGMRMRLYRTENGGSVFYDTAASDSSTGIGIHTLTDHCSDATLIGQQALTDGPAVNGGIKARYGFPPHRCSWNGRDRIIVGGLENPRRVRWSLLSYPGEATAFPHASEQGWAADIPDDVTAVAQLDDAWVVFSRTHIWSIYGAGPDDNGASGGFDPPRLISPNLGCVSWKSLAEVEGGLLFQGADGQIYLLQRGQLTVQWFSARIRDELSAGMAGTQLLNPIVSVIPHDAGQTIHFIRAPLPGGNSPTIVYDRRTDAWTTDGDTGVDGLNGAIGGASVLDIFSAAAAGQQTVCTITPSSLTLENQTGTPMAPIGASWTSVIETNDMAPFGLAGMGQVHKIGIILETSVSPVSIDFAEYLNRRDNVSGYGTLTFTNDISPFFGDFPFLEWAPGFTKCSAVRLQITWTEPTCALVGLVLEVIPSGGTERLRTSRKA